MLFIYLYHDVLYTDLWKSDLYFRPALRGQLFSKEKVVSLRVGYREYFMESAGVRYFRTSFDISEIERVSAANE